ncbi:MAG TPA: hypothetical protein VFM54_19895 [Micromonosporaceae bacterium]|nr:hypothetical protein [Micromonosporaceae bacterium]
MTASRAGEWCFPTVVVATAYRVLGELERRHPTLRLSAKRNQDVAARPGGV